jgi:hypothetical protein
MKFVECQLLSQNGQWILKTLILEIRDVEFMIPVTHECVNISVLVWTLNVLYKRTWNWKSTNKIFGF